MIRNRNLFWKLVEPEHVRARAFCRKLMGNREDGDDLYQDCLVIGLTKFSKLKEVASFRPWLYRILVNTFKNRIRRPWWRRHAELTRDIEDNVASDNPTALYAARRRLETAFRAVSPKERALVTLFEMEGWSIIELAGLFGKSEGTIKMRLSRTRRKMRRALAREIAGSGSQPVVQSFDSKEQICVATKPGEN